MLAAHIGELQQRQMEAPGNRAGGPSLLPQSENFGVAWKREMVTPAEIAEEPHPLSLEKASDRATGTGDGSQERATVSFGTVSSASEAKLKGDEPVNGEPVDAPKKTLQTKVAAPGGLVVDGAPSTPTKLKVGTKAEAVDKTARPNPPAASTIADIPGAMILGWVPSLLVGAQGAGNAAVPGSKEAINLGAGQDDSLGAHGTQQDAAAKLLEGAQNIGEATVAPSQEVPLGTVSRSALAETKSRVDTRGLGTAKSSFLELKLTRQDPDQAKCAGISATQTIEPSPGDGAAIATSTLKDARPGHEKHSGGNLWTAMLASRSSEVIAEVALRPSRLSELTSVAAAASTAGHASPAIGADLRGWLDRGGTPDFGGVQEHQILAAGLKQLEVGLMDGTHGWLKIRAELGTDGLVSASLTGSPTAHQSLRQALPEIASYLEREAVDVSRIAVHRATESSPMMGLMRDGEGQDRHNQGDRAGGKDNPGDSGVAENDSAERKAYAISTNAGVRASVTNEDMSSQGLLSAISTFTFGFGEASVIGGSGSGSWLNVRV